MDTFRLINIAQLSKLRVFALAALLLVLGNQRLNAQVGGDNPTGVAGAFNGQITTGCSYDAYTGNATRSCTDLAVTSVGNYPLALVRIANSRRAQASNTANPFGVPGHWNHSYNWILEDSEKRTTQPFQPSSYTVEFPDGRVETFNSVNWDPGYYRVRAIGGDQTTAAGVRDRVAPMNPPQSNMVVKLFLPDGGRIEFLASLRQSGSNWYYSYVAQAIYDPYGLATTFTHDGSGRLTRVTEPAGRYLQFSYRTTTGQTHMIDKVTEWINGGARRIVQYNYTNVSPGGQSYLALTSVSYFSQWTATYTYCAPNIPPTMGVPLLRTCDDPMYPGPMHKIAYVYRTATNPDGSTPANGQIQSENYYNGSVGAAVSTLAVTGTNTRQETRGDGKTRTLTYGTGADSGFLMSWTDFTNRSASQTYDDKKYVNSVTDRNNHRTDYTLDAITGNVTQIQFPLTTEDTPGQTQRPTVNYTYTNNYYLHTIQDEGIHTTTITPDSNNRVTRIDYPDGGYQTFGYDQAHFYQLNNHRMVTGGIESFTYDARHRRDTYRNPDNVTGNPTARYGYDDYDRVQEVTDVLGTSLGDGNHTTTFGYNDRGQVESITLPFGDRIFNFYNPDGTLQSRMDQLFHTTSYAYDDYRRLKSVTPPDRNDGTGLHTTHFYYGDSAADNVTDYRYTDSKVTWVVLPSGKKTKTVYDDNRRKSSVTVAYGTSDAATTSYGYDFVGNVTSVVAPNEQPGQPYAGQSTQTVYDQRNRPSSVTDALNKTTSFTYDLAGRKRSITRPNSQTITYNSYDAMNRLLQQTATQTPDPDAVTKYTYYTIWDGGDAPVGLLKTMQDPRLVAMNSAYKYTYGYDNMGRKTSVQYPPDSLNQQRTEEWAYDTVGHLQTFTNRNSNIQTFTYDALNRMTGFSWNDGGFTPSVSFGYDAASRLISVNNANANITRAYYNDNLIQSETEQILLNGGTSKTVSYAYEADGNRSGMTYPDNSYSFTYGYTSRNQLNSIVGVATYGYDVNGNMISRELLPRGSGSFTYDALDRVKHIEYSFLISGDGYGGDPRPTPTPRPPPTWQSRTFDYDYDSVGNRKWMKREDNSGDVFGYDVSDQVIACWLDIMDPDITPPGDQSIFYDGSGNRTAFNAYEWLEGYTINNLNQYTLRNVSERMDPRPTPTPRPRPTPPPRPSPTPSPTPPGQQQTATYDYNGNMATGFDSSIYLYDAQNRLVSSTAYGVTVTFTYDGLNRQVSRTVTGGLSIGGGTTYSVWDGWNLIEEYQSGNNVTARYLYGPNGIVKNLTNNNCYFQDGSGSTSYLTDAFGNLLEFYLYDLQGTPRFFDGDGNALWESALGVRHLFTGQQWYSELGLYDLRNRFYSPDIGRFLQPDPIDFNGDPTNLYRYCGNNPVTRSDPTGKIAFIDWGVTERGRAYIEAINIPITYAGGTTEQQNFISWAMGDYLSKLSNYYIPVYASGGSSNPITNTLLIALGNVSPNVQTSGPNNDWAAIYIYQGEESAKIYMDAAKIGWFFMGVELQNILMGGEGGGMLNTAEYGGMKYVYDANWNWIGNAVYYYAVMSDGTIYKYNSNWQWISTISGGGGGTSGRDGGGRGPGGGWGWGTGGYSAFGGGSPSFGPGFAGGSYSGPGFGWGFWSLGPSSSGPGTDRIRVDY